MLWRSATSSCRPFASPRFEQLWIAADGDVQTGRVDRSWTWGPRPWFDYREFYQQSPDGLRLVQYFDKARMELNDPANTNGLLRGVTNGLLPVELISGRIKLGDSTGNDQFEQRSAALLAVAGDPANENPDAPTYADFTRVATTDNGYRDPPRVGQRIGTTFAREGAAGFRQDLAAKPGTDIVVYEDVTGHNVPRVFEEFRNAGPIPAIAAFGLPITDPYWITTRVGGVATDVLVQMFERRVITYTPSNPRAFQVEMGNVGQHYFQWRYPNLSGLGRPWNTDEPRSHSYILYASRVIGTAFGLFTVDPDGANQYPTIPPPEQILPYTKLRAWGSEQERVFGETTRFGGMRQLVSLRYPYGTVERAVIGDADDFHPAVSPDGRKLAFASTRDGNPELYLVNLDPQARAIGASPTRLTETTGCANQYPSWLPDGSGLVYESNCQGGVFAIYRAGLSYLADKADAITLAHPISPDRATRLTGGATADRSPRVSPDGTRIVFTSLRDGNAEIYIMRSDGGGVMRVTEDPAVDDAPSWSGDGKYLVFNSNRDGDHELFVINPDRSYFAQITTNNVDDGYAIWAQ
jgi:hypothetical protein